MKLSAILEDEENMMIIPLCWLDKEEHWAYINTGYQVIPIPGYKETSAGYRAFKIIGKYNDTFWLIRKFSIPIWEDWKLTANYIWEIRPSMDSFIQMFDRLEDDEKIQALTYGWGYATITHIKKYFEDHPDLLKRANSLKQETIYSEFKDLFTKI